MRIPARLAAVLAALAATAALAACGSTDITAASEGFQRENLAQLGLELECPDSASEGENFDCTISNAESGESQEIPFRLENGDTLDVADDAQFEEVVSTLSGEEVTTGDETVVPAEEE